MSWKISTRGIPQSITGVAPTLDYRFAIDRNEIDAISLTDKLTFTGGNQGTFVGSDGFIQRATTNVPRFDHDPLSRKSLGLLSEGSRENLLLQSNRFDTTWTNAGSTENLNAAISPDGTLNATALVDTAVSETHALIQSITLSGSTTYTISCWLKKGSVNYGRFAFTPNASWGGGLGANAFYDLTDGTVSASSNTTVTVQEFPSGWYRCSATATTVASPGAANVVIGSSATGTAAIYLGTATEAIYLWGAQLEAASTPSTYIPTTSAAVTRTADSAVIDGTGVITGTYTMVEKPAGCAVVSGSNIELQPGFRAERIAVFPAALTNDQITAVRAAM
jgi:hypothetical protein